MPGGVGRKILLKPEGASFVKKQSREDGLVQGEGRFIVLKSEQALLTELNETACKGGEPAQEPFCD